METKFNFQKFFIVFNVIFKKINKLTLFIPKLMTGLEPKSNSDIKIICRPTFKDYSVFI